MSIIQEISRKIHVESNNRLTWPDITLLFLLFFYIMAGLPLVPFHGDESAYLWLSEDYNRIVEKRDFGKVLFNANGNNKQYLRLSTGSILAFSIGFARDITNNHDPIKKWLWGSSWEGNIAQGNMPSPGLLNLARTCSALMGALGIVPFFLLAYHLFSSRLIAWSATLMLATHGGVLVNIRRAMQEGPKFLFLILTAYIASYILKNLQSVKLYRYPYVLIGIASGLTLASKQDTAPMLVAIYLALALVPIWGRKTVRTILVNCLYLGAATILAYAFFLVLMPVFWRWWETAFALVGVVVILFQLPVWKAGRSAKLAAIAGCLLVIGMTMVSPTQWNEFQTPIVSMIDTRDTLVEGQLTRFGDQNLFDPYTTRNRMTFLLENTFSSKVMYMEVPSFDVLPFHEIIKTYEESLFSGRTGSPWVDGFIAILFVVGGWSLLRTFEMESLFVYSLLITTSVLLFFIIPLSWQRYFLIIQIPYLLIAGVGVHQIWLWIKSHVDVRSPASA